MKRFTPRIRGLLAGAAVATLTWGGAAQAQTAPSATEDSAEGAQSTVNDIVVTAQKREQNLQDVPISITAIGAEAIGDARIQNVEQISGFAPNVITLPQIGGNQLAGFTIRGIVASNSAPESDDPVAIYVDGVYVGRPAGAVFDLADIERIEVLRGPQGTLFGRNSTGGAISIVTSNPSGEFGGEVQATLSNYDGRRIRARVDTPDFNGLSAQFVFLYNKRDGDVRNLGAGTTWDFTAATGGRRGLYRAADTLGAVYTKAFRGALRFEPGADLTLDYKFDYTHNQGSPGATGTILPAAVTEGTIDFINAALFGRQGVTGDFTPSPERPDAINNWFTSNSNQKVSGHNLTAEWHATDRITVKNIASYRRLKSNSINQLDGIGGLIDDQSGSPFLAVSIASENDFKQYSNELQVNYDSDAVDLVGGFYLFKEKLRSGGPGIPQVFFFGLAPDFEVAAGPVTENHFVNKSTALYLQGTIHLSEKLDVTLGGRETWDDKTAVYNQPPILGTFGYKKSQFNYLANITFRPNDEVMLYALTSTGYLSGGTVNGTPFQPEEVTNYEVGAKTDLLDRRLRLNGALFYQNYRNLQFTVFPNGSAVLLNGGKSEIYGAEAEITAVPFRGLTLNAGFGYTHFKWKELDPSIGDPDNFTVFFRPKWTTTLGATYEFSASDNGSVLSFGIDTQANAKYYTVTSAAVRDLTRSPETWLVNARATLADLPLGGSTTGKVQVWVKNLTDEKGLTFGGEVIPGGLVSAFYRPARTYGIDFSVKF